MAIDLTGRYHLPRYQRKFNRRGQRIDWTVDRSSEPVLALMIHHTTGYYLGVTLDENATRAQEVAQIDAMADDHRNRFGIGPGYHYAAFESGRLYAIGKYGTHRAHVKGINPATQNLWNRESLAIVGFGNFQRDQVLPRLWAAITEGIREVNKFVGEDLTLYGHREVPGNPTQTSCPGDYLMAKVDAWRAPPFEPEPDPDIDVARREIQAAQRALARALELLA